MIQGNGTAANSSGTSIITGEQGADKKNEKTVSFTSTSGVPFTAKASRRIYHAGRFNSDTAKSQAPVPHLRPIHLNLAQSLSKHSTYGFNPGYHPITPDWFIAATNAAITGAYFDGDIDGLTYGLLIAGAGDTFFGCLVEQFGDKGGTAPWPTSNVGEVAIPLNNNGFIQDNSNRALKLADKLTNPFF